MVSGSLYQNTNIRNTPFVSSGTFVKSYPSGTTFEGEIVKGGDGRDWINLSKVNGQAVTSLYVAAWVVNYKEVVSTPPPVVEPPMFPESFVLTDPSGNKAEYKFVRIVE